MGPVGLREGSDTTSAHASMTYLADVAVAVRDAAVLADELASNSGFGAISKVALASISLLISSPAAFPLAQTAAAKPSTARPATACSTKTIMPQELVWLSWMTELSVPVMNQPDAEVGIERRPKGIEVEQRAW